MYGQRQSIIHRSCYLQGKTGCAWRDLPEKYGKWHSVHKRFLRWSRKGVWQAIFNTLAYSADKEWLMIDSTIVRVHQYACGAKGGKISRSVNPEAAEQGRFMRYAIPMAIR